MEVEKRWVKVNVNVLIWWAKFTFLGSIKFNMIAVCEQVDEEKKCLKKVFCNQIIICNYS